MRDVHHSTVGWPLWEQPITCPPPGASEQRGMGGHRKEASVVCTWSCEHRRWPEEVTGAEQRAHILESSRLECLWISWEPWMRFVVPGEPHSLKALLRLWDVCFVTGSPVSRLPLNVHGSEGLCMLAKHYISRYIHFEFISFLL